MNFKLSVRKMVPVGIARFRSFAKSHIVRQTSPYHAIHVNSELISLTIKLSQDKRKCPTPLVNQLRHQLIASTLAHRLWFEDVSARGAFFVHFPLGFGCCAWHPMRTQSSTLLVFPFVFTRVAPTPSPRVWWWL